MGASSQDIEEEGRTAPSPRLIPSSPTICDPHLHPFEFEFDAPPRYEYEETPLGGTFQRRESRERGSLAASSQDIEEEGRTSPPPILISASAPSPSPTVCDPHLHPLESEFDAPPSYEEALTMKGQEGIKLVEPS